MKLFNSDCLDGMKALPDGCVDMVMVDLPYGTTSCAWDSIIPFDKLWEAYYRVAKKNAAFVFTASQPFTTKLIGSNIEDFRYCWVWEKEQGVNFLLAKKNPMKVHEDVPVFYREFPTYNPQITYSTPYTTGLGGFNPEFKIGAEKRVRVENKEGTRYPRSIVRVNTEKGLHPTQKPVWLMEYFIRTYTNPGETVLDNTMGSGTTGVACIQAGRNFIGMELDAARFREAAQRLENVTPALECFQ